MRRTILVALLFATLLLIPAGVLAAKDEAADARGKANSRAETRAAHARTHGHDDNGANETSEANETRGPPAATRQAERGERLQAFLARLKEIRVAWLEGARALRESCHADHAEEDDETLTREARLAQAHCIREGHKALHETMRADLRTAMQEFRGARAG